MMPSDRKLLLVSAAAALLLIAVTVITSAPGAADSRPTTYSTASNGAKAVYLLLQEAGYESTRWERPIADLKEAGNATLILAEPDEQPTADDRSAVKMFIEQGGRVIATGPLGAAFLPDIRIVPDVIAGMTWMQVSSRSPSPITRAAPDIVLAPQAFWDGHGPALPLYGDHDSVEKVRVVKARAGKGEMLWWASATPLTNAGVREPGNLEFVLASVGAPGTVFWDEYVHGHRSTQDASPFASPFIWAALPLLLGSAAVLVTYSRRSGPILAPASESRLSPLEFVRTLGALYRRAGAASVPVDTFYQGFRFRLSRRLGISTGASPDDVVQAIRSRGLDAGLALRELLLACESARHDPTLTAPAALALTQSLYDCSVALNLYSSSKEHA